MHRPRCQETRERNRAGHTRLPQATGDVRPRAPNPSPQRKLGPQEAATPLNSSTVIASRESGAAIQSTTLHRPKGDKQPTRHNSRN